MHSVTYIERSITPYLLKAERDFKAVLVTGARQTGKSTLLKAQFPQNVLEIPVWYI